MKRIIAITVLLSVMLGCCACQPTPEKPPVVSKNDGQLEKALFEGADENYVYEAPEKFSYEKEHMGGAAHVTCDNTAVSVIKNSNYAVYSAKPKQFTADDFMRIADVCFPDADVTLHLDGFSKDDVKKYMLEPLEKIIWEIECGEYDIPDDVTMGDDETGEVYSKERMLEITKNGNKAMLSYAKSMYENAPDAVTGEPFNLRDYKIGDSLSLDMTMNDGTVGRIYYDAKGMMSHIDVSLGEYRIEHTQNSSIGLSDLGGAYVYSQEDIDALQFTEEYTLAQAKAFMQKIGTDEFEFCSYKYATAYTPANLTEFGSVIDYDMMYEFRHSNRKTYRGVVFIRKIDDVPVGDFSSYAVSFNHNFEKQSFIYERFIVWVGENGVAGFSWDCPLETELVQSSVRLMPFDDVKQRVCDGLFYRCAGSFTEGKLIEDERGNSHETVVTYPLSRFNANISLLELRYMQILKKDNIGEFLLLPVWCAYCSSATAEYEGYTPPMPNDGSVRDCLIIGQDEAIDFLTENTITKSPSIVINAIDGSTVSVKKGY